jgi:hypothetical protein
VAPRRKRKQRKILSKIGTAVFIVNPSPQTPAEPLVIAPHDEVRPIVVVSGVNCRSAAADRQQAQRDGSRASLVSTRVTLFVNRPNHLPARHAGDEGDKETNLIKKKARNGYC